MGTTARRFRENTVVRVVVGFALAAAVLAAFGWLVTGPYKNVVSGFDANIRYAMRQIQSPMWTSLLLTLTKLGSTLYLIIVGCIAGVLFLVYRWFRPFVLFVILMAGQAALHHGFKWLFERPRPAALLNYPAAESFSYPSGHVIGALCLYGSIAWIVSKRFETPAAKAGVWMFAGVLIFLIAMSRAYIGVHYPTDVVAGLIGAAVWTTAVMTADRRPL
ncbi:MAG TPA: phosphatase PAP2 family protein [Pyrinomonadaceae bacterium]|nr:phosphatase PAP2 family protein [Pyrinomonadaceae bacterium]